MIGGPFRIQPQLPVEAMQTYEIIAPQATHFRVATCAEINCLAFTRGWVTAVDETSELGQRQAHYIRKESRRSFKETREESGRTVFTFEPGQKCFAQHKTRIDRPEIYVVRNGDWRRSEVRRQHSRAVDWVEDFAEHQDKIKEQTERG